MTVAHRKYKVPVGLNRPPNNPRSMKTKIATAQTRSTNARKVKITLSVPDWTKNEEKAKT